MRYILLLAFGLVLLASCSDDDSDPAGPATDTQAPAAIADLDTTLGPSNELLLRWTAPGDDGGQGTATAYDLRYSSGPADSFAWDDALPVSGTPAPLIAGSLQTVVLDETFESGEWSFAIRAADKVPNWSELSNVVELVDDDPPLEYPVATTENQLIDNFEQAHRDLHFLEYENMLAENFTFWFAPEDLDLAPNGLFWDRAADVSSTDRMFNGEVGERPDGSPQPAVRSISLTLTPAEPAWIDAGGEVVGGVTAMPADAKKRRYNAAMRVTWTEGDLVSEVNGEQLFYVIPTQLDLGGDETVTEWKMLLWRDFGQTTKASTEGVNWGQIKARF